MKIQALRRPTACWARAISDRVPPSPLLSARIRKKTYLNVTTTISAQNASDTTPTTARSPPTPPRA